MFNCKSCGAPLDLTASTCSKCGAAVELGRLTGILGVVCRACDSYNEPRAKVCASCGAALGGADAPQPTSTATAASSPAPPPPRAPPGAPVVRAFAKDAGGAPATRFVPLAPKGSAPAAPGAPISLVTHCPRCGAEAGPGQFCARCGQPLGQRGTHVMSKSSSAGRGATGPLATLVPGHVKLVLERGEGSDGATFRLDGEATEAGRSKGAVLFPDDPCLAPHHATFFYSAGTLHVRDEGAPGGVFLRLRGLSVPLRAGDVFAVGDRLLKYAGPLPPAPPPPPDGTRRLGAPRPPGAAMVVEEWLEGGVAGRVFVRGGPSVTIGRAGCAINLGDDPYLSQAHAEILIEQDGGARLRDLGSSNGTYARIPPRAERELRDGDCVRMGREVLRVAAAP